MVMQLVMIVMMIRFDISEDDLRWAVKYLIRGRGYEVNAQDIVFKNYKDGDKHILGATVSCNIGGDEK